jgi:hypothetical protein
MPHDTFLQHHDVGAMSFRGTQEVISVRAACDNAVTARLQKSLNPGAYDLLPSSDYQSGSFGARGLRPGRNAFRFDADERFDEIKRNIDIRGHGRLPHNAKCFWTTGSRGVVMGSSRSSTSIASPSRGTRIPAQPLVRPYARKVPNHIKVYRQRLIFRSSDTGQYKCPVWNRPSGLVLVRAHSSNLLHFVALRPWHPNKAKPAQYNWSDFPGDLPRKPFMSGILTL